MPLRRAHFGYDDALKYINAYKTKVANKEPIITQRGIHRDPTQDMYFKGALFLNTLRSVVNDDAKWWKLMRDLYQHFKYKNILTEDMVAFFNKQLGQDLTPVFDQYLRRADLPVLELTFDEAEGDGGVSLEGRRARLRDADPGRRSRQVARHPPDDGLEGHGDAAEKDAFQVATDLYYVNVTKQ